MAAATVGDTEGGTAVAVDVNETGETPGRVHDPSAACDTPPGGAEVVVCGPAVAGKTTRAMVELIEETAGMGGLLDFMVK